MNDYADIDEILRSARKRGAMNSHKEAGAALSNTWEAIQKAHDHTTAAVVLREAEPPMHREFGLIAVADLAAARDAAEEGVRQQAIYLVRVLNVAASTVAQQAGVAGTTVSRWVASAEDNEQ